MPESDGGNSMMEGKMRFASYPTTVKYAVSMVYFAWLFFIISGVILTGKISIFHLTMCMLIFVLTHSLKRWGRIFLILYNSFMAIFIGIELYSHLPLTFGDGHTIARVASICLFLLSVILLLLKDARIFYREHGA